MVRKTSFTMTILDDHDDADEDGDLGDDTGADSDGQCLDHVSTA